MSDISNLINPFVYTPGTVEKMLSKYMSQRSAVCIGIPAELFLNVGKSFVVGIFLYKSGLAQKAIDLYQNVSSYSF